MSLSIRRTSITLLAGALVLTLSACASRPIVDPDSRTGRAGEKLSQAGQKIGEFSSDLWVKTKHVFRLDGTDAYHGDEALAQKNPVEMPGKFKDEIDLALVQDEFETGPGDKDSVILSAVELDSADQVELEPLPVIEIVSVEPAAKGLELAPPSDLILGTEALGTEALGTEALGTEVLGTEVLVTEAVTDEQIIEEIALVPSNTSADTPAFAKADLSYDVQANENLWDISKRLTGDATNWQQLAALNSLDHNGTVYYGQTLQIPGDMLRKEPAPDTSPTLAAATPAEPASTRIKVPTGSAVEAVSEVIVADSTTETEAPAALAGPSTLFKVQAGESMWEMAKRTTGDATNWKGIAAANNMTAEEAALIKYGQSLEIPNDLLKTPADGTPAEAVAAIPLDEAAEQVDVATTEVVSTEVASAAPAIESTVTTDSGTTEVVSTDSLKIMPAKFQAEPTVINAASEEPATGAAEDADWVMVSGTYYPKAVYNDANFSATLLTRVSPGTKLQVSRAIGPWFEVKTDHGMGYVHSRDIK